MLKKTITFEDLDGNKLTEDFYFYLSKAEIAEMELLQKDGLEGYLKKIVAEEDREKLMELFKGLITKSVGRRSEDGRRFIKNQAIVDEFVQSDAYSEFFIELISNADAASEFVNGIVPVSIQNALAADASNASTEEPTWLKEGRTPTQEEVRQATPEQLQMAFQRKQTNTAPVPDAIRPPTEEPTAPAGA